MVNGNNDIIIPTINSYLLQQHAPNAQLILYPDANHGAHHQYPSCSSSTPNSSSTPSRSRRGVDQPRALCGRVGASQSTW
ncbi:hypothetical protein AB0I10_40340 [Streptomyces sp. NPDC050636]|uniref:hypothetical protein n=1 Tax=Streptomyces sp. NPDC050636 TaxID=3154510 RepID=UPI003440E8CD